MRDYILERLMGSRLPQATHESDRASKDALKLARDTPVWTERMMQALVSRAEIGWYSLIDKVVARNTLLRAFDRVRQNGGASGVDRQSVDRFALQLDREITKLQEELKTGRYRPLAVRRVEIPKSDGSMRPLGIPAVRDRVVQGAIKEVIEPIYEHLFESRSYGFRPSRGAKDALREVRAALKEERLYVVDADLRAYFDTIPHSTLKDRVREQIHDRALNALIDQFLRQDVMSDCKTWTPTCGTPQGAVLSPLLANLYLHPLDRMMREAGRWMVRYADDFVVLCTSAAEASQTLEMIQDWVSANGLELHPTKTRVADLTAAGGHFDFLGYRFYRSRTGLRHFIRPKKAAAIRDTLRDLTPRHSGRSLEATIARLNPVLRGLFEYFQHSGGSSLKDIDQFVRRRLRRMLRVRLRKRRGSGHFQADHHRWPNAYFQSRGLFSMVTSRAAKLHSSTT